MLLNVYALSAINAQLCEPARTGRMARATDLDGGHFRYSLDGRTHSDKNETTYSKLVAALVIDDSRWEVYESTMGNPVLLSKATRQAYNLTTDVVIDHDGRNWTLDVVGDGRLQAFDGLKIEEPSRRSLNSWDFTAIADYYA